MARKRYSEEGWAKAPQHLTRCVGTMRNGMRCGRVAETGTNVCELHGGLAPQVQAAAAQRMVHSAPAAAEALLQAMNDPAVPWGVRVKIMQDVLDRSDVVGRTVHEHHVKVDPVEAMFKSILEDPDGLVDAPPAPPAIESGQVVQGEVVAPNSEDRDAVDDNDWPDADIKPLRQPKPVTVDTRIPKHMRDRLPPGA